MGKQNPNHFYFGRDTCAICLGSKGKLVMRYMNTILDCDQELEGGLQAVHPECIKGLHKSMKAKA